MSDQYRIERVNPHQKMSVSVDVSGVVHTKVEVHGMDSEMSRLVE